MSKGSFEVNSFYVGLLFALFLSLTSHGQDPIEATQALLKSPTLRQDALKSPEAIAADRNIRALGDARGQTQEIYNLSSSIFVDLAKNNNQDPNEMMRSLEAAQRDPAAFINSMTPEQKAKLKDIATQLEAPASRP